ncbi:MAG: pyridoxamine 5'-phosphate oxidase family protein [Clostridium sp.]
MRRKDREIKDINEIIDIMKRCDSCSIALFDDEYPYIVPVNFGFDCVKDKVTLYIHGAKAGKKLELINKNNKVAFDMSCNHKLITGEKACNYTMEYESVCGNGIVKIIEGDEKKASLQILMKQYTMKEDLELDDKVINAVTVFKIDVCNISGKRLKR